MKIFKATRRYEAWLHEHLDVFEEDLALKRRLFSRDPFIFLRGTFYRWMQLFPEVCRRAADAPAVLSVGDLHASNFGTWREAGDELVWGVNDFDEAASLPYTQDLIRLAASVELASETERLRISLQEACVAILDGYREGLETGGKPFVVDREGDWLRKAYVKSGRQAEKYWQELRQCADVQKHVRGEVLSLLEAGLPARGLPCRLLHRQAGVGSLGRPRFTLLAEWQGGFVALEAKALLPSAALWARGRQKGAEILYGQVLARAVRRPDPVMKVHGGWVVRALAPDRCRIGLSELGPERQETRMMYAMGRETANIHLGTRSAVKDVLRDLKESKPDWLEKYARSMVGETLRDWEMWRDGDRS